MKGPWFLRETNLALHAGHLVREVVIDDDLLGLNNNVTHVNSVDMLGAGLKISMSAKGEGKKGKEGDLDGEEGKDSSAATNIENDFVLNMRNYLGINTKKGK